MHGSISIRVRLYAQYRQIAGVDEVELQVSESGKVYDALLELVQQLPGLRNSIRQLIDEDGSENQAVLVIDRRVVTLDTPVRSEDELKLLPPISGG